MENRKGLVQTFMDGGKSGFQLWFNNVVPAIIFGYVIVQFLNVSGLMNVFSIVFTPVMRIFGLPGEAATAIITSYLTLPAGCAMAASMVQGGILSTREVTILFPMMYAVSSHLLYIGRVLGTSGVESKKYPLFIAVGLICSCIAGLVMNILV
ncbi:MAG: nucleoside recognition domain-containing protein [Erysipelotrichaceae bacterium]|nr:nucleoside recognition domain-containing protein [Erysipelotrichaceae bacterium]